jgi:AcrR family transcriptional regulator
MSPFPAKIDPDSIPDVAYRLIDKHGLQGLTMVRLASALDARAPSLYRYIESKQALLQSVNLLTMRKLLDAYRAALENAPADPLERLLAVLEAQRAYAHAHPHPYRLAFATRQGLPEGEQGLVRMLIPIHALTAQVVGDEHALLALRGALALVHGFVTLESGAPTENDDDPMGNAFRQCARAYLLGWGRAGKELRR